MKNETHYFLSGGVLFFLLVQATQPNGTAADHRSGIKDSHSSPTLMKDLIYTFTGSHNYGAGKDTSKYRGCQIEGSVNLPFNNTAIIAAYHALVIESYDVALSRMSEFIAWHINLEMKTWLVQALLDIIEHDAEIADTDIFYILSDGLPITKEKLQQLTTFEFQPFMVGILHFILHRRHGTNKNGLDTLNMISEKEIRKERTYTGNLGASLSRQITVSLYEKLSPPEIIDLDTEEEDESTFGSKSPSKLSDHEVLTESMLHTGRVMAEAFGRFEHEQADRIRQNWERQASTTQRQTFTNNEAEVEDSQCEPSGAANEEKKVTVIQQQTNVIQNGDHNVNVTNNGTMNFNFGGGAAK